MNHSTNKTDVYLIVDIWKLIILDLKDYRPEKNRGYRFVLKSLTTSVSLDGQFLSKMKMMEP